MGPIFQDRADAGKQLAKLLMKYAHDPKVLVLALPRGGVPVGYEVARALNAPLDVFLVRKLGVPGHEELAMGAIASGGFRVMNEDVVRYNRISPDMIEQGAAQEQLELARREQNYLGERQHLPVTGRKVVLTDDGLATGASMRAAVQALRTRHPLSITVAVPVAAPQTCADLRKEVDDLVYVQAPDPFYAVGTWYANFLQTEDEEVRRLLDQAARAQARRGETALAE